MTDDQVATDTLDALIDDLVTDAINDAQAHAVIANKTVERITSDARLEARYGDFQLGLAFGGSGGRIARTDIHKALKAKGLALRAIAAETGVSYETVRRDLAVTDVTPDERALVTDVTSQTDDTSGGHVVRDEEAQQRLRVKELLLINAKMWQNLGKWMNRLAPGEVVPLMDADEIFLTQQAIINFRQALDRWENEMSGGLKVHKGGKG